MRYEFLERKCPSLSTRVSVIASALIVGAYSVWTSPFQIKTLVFLLILLVLIGSMFILTELIVIDTEYQILSKIKRLWKFNLPLTGTTIKLDDVLSVFINKARYSQSIQSSRSFHSVTTHGIEYSAFLKLTDGTTFHLGTANDKDFFLSQLNKMALIIKVDLRDNTE